MDIKSMNDVQKQLFQRVIQKLVARNQCTPSEVENMQKLLDNVRDTKNFHMIMEKLKDCGQIELDSFEENFKEGGKREIMSVGEKNVNCLRQQITSL
jgi:hypothetical protein